jgi:uncharacterized protein
VDSRINIITLGVKDVNNAVRFYQKGLGWSLSSVSGGDFAIFLIQTGTALALYPRHLLAADARVKDPGGFGGITLAQNVSTKEEVGQVLSQAIQAGAVLLKAAGNTEWGGYSGYFADPDGHPWEVAWSPQLRLEQGRLVLPE